MLVMRLTLPVLSKAQAEIDTGFVAGAVNVAEVPVPKEAVFAAHQTLGAVRAADQRTMTSARSGSGGLAQVTVTWSALRTAVRPVTYRAPGAGEMVPGGGPGAPVREWQGR